MPKVYRACGVLMLMPKPILTLSLLSLVVFMPLSSAQNSTLDLLTKTLMGASGLDKQIEQIPLTIDAVLRRAEQQSTEAPVDQFQNVREMIDSVYDLDVLESDAKAYLQAHLSESEVKFILDWLKDELGRKITESETELATPEAYPKAKKMWAKTDPNSERLQKLVRLDDAVKGTETTLSLLLNSNLVGVLAVSAAMASEREDLIENLTLRARQRSEKIRPIIEKQVHTLWLYAYESLSDDELEEYIRFAQSELGSKYHDAIFSATQVAMDNARQKLSELIGTKPEATP